MNKKMQGGKRGEFAENCKDGGMERLKQSEKAKKSAGDHLHDFGNDYQYMSQQLIAEQSKFWACEDFPIVKDSLHVTRRIAYFNKYIHTCLTTRKDSPEEGEVQSFRVKNDSVLVLVAADIVDMYMSITKQFVLTTVDEYLLARVDKHIPGTPGRKAAEAFRSTYMQLAILSLSIPLLVMISFSIDN